MRVAFFPHQGRKKSSIQTNPSRFDGLEGFMGDARRGYACFSTKVKLHEYIVIVLIQIFDSNFENKF